MILYMIWLFATMTISYPISTIRRTQSSIVLHKLQVPQQDSIPLFNITITPCNDTTHIAVYSGMMKMIYINIINPHEMFINIQDVIYSDIDSRSISTLDVSSFILSSLLRLSYENHKKNEIKYIQESYYQRKNTSYYFGMKKMATFIFLLLYTIFCRNIHSVS